MPRRKSPTAKPVAPSSGGSAVLPSKSAMRRALRRADDGVALNVTEATVLLHARGEDLDRLCASAARVRDAGLVQAGRPGTVTYSRKVFLPVTRLCRDRCHYCTFVTVPGKLARAGQEPFMRPDDVLDVAREGAAQGCKEALLTLGDRPEDRWPEARQWLDSHGYESTLAYVRAMAILVLEETGLLPHLNPGVMSWEELARLKPVAPSMGMMLETSSARLCEPGMPHHGSPDKDPAVRLRTLADAGRHSIPFTTGVLVGIGETPGELAQSVFDIREQARSYGHVQEVIVQNFRAKPDTAMRAEADLGMQAYLAAIAVTRLVLGPRMRVQAPPNLTDPDGLAGLLAAGVDDWGGVSPVTPDHVNPERPWPQLDDLERWSAEAGSRLVERLTVHPEYVTGPEQWIDPRVRPHVEALITAEGLARPATAPVGRPWQEPDSTWSPSGRVDLGAEIDVVGRFTQRRADVDDVFGDWTALSSYASASSPTRGSDARLSPAERAALAAAESRPGDLSVSHATTLADADGEALRALVALADDLRRDRVGDVVTFVVNRNINFTNVCYTGCRFCAFAQRRDDADAFTLSLEQVADRATEAVRAGATEVCMQGGLHPDLPGTAYLDLARAVKTREPGLHLHAFSPMEVVHGATRTGMSIRDFLVAMREAGVDTIPGTAAEILDDDVRWVLTKGKLPASTWVEVVTTAHEVGLRSSATMMYGHVDTPAHWAKHLSVIRDIQDRTGGFTEFVPLPFVHQNSPIYLAGIARAGSTRREDLAVHALARVMLDGRVPHIQTSWVKLGVAGCRSMLQAGCDDLGGTLMEETISRMAGAEHGSAKTPQEIGEVAAGIGRPIQQRTTLYGQVNETLSA